MKKLLLLLVLSAAHIFAYGQKTTVAIKTMRGISERGSINAGQAKIEDFVTDKFVTMKKFDIVDRASMQDLKSEKELQKTEDFIDGKVIEQSKTLGADYLVGIYISTMDITKSTGTTSGYGSKITFSLKILDIATSQVIATETFSASSGQLLSFMSTPGAAIDKTLGNMSAKLETFINSNFPAKASIADIEKFDEEGKAYNVLISAGSSSGVSVGDNFMVMESVEIDVDGKKMTRKKEIASLQVISVEDENFSVCAVTGGGRNIAKKKAEGKKLQVIAQK
jgi:hypothetical protein